MRTSSFPMVLILAAVATACQDHGAPAAEEASSTTAGTSGGSGGPFDLGEEASAGRGFEIGEGGIGGVVRGAGDVNGDGLADVILGAPEIGMSYVVFGKADTEPVMLTQIEMGVGGFALSGGPGGAEGDRFGEAVGGAGDVNADGFADLIVAARLADAETTDSGKSYVVFGKPDGNPIDVTSMAGGQSGFELDGEAESDQVGVSVSGAGDMNGDGRADLVMGSVASSNGLFSGRSYVVWGKVDTATVSLSDVANEIGGFALDGEASNEAAYVSGAGDVNGDGTNDLIVGAPGLLPGGRIYVLFGSGDATSTTLDEALLTTGGFAMDGETAWGAGVRVGYASSAGDVNGDAFDDLIVALPGASPASGMYAGRCYIVFGKDTPEPVLLADVALGIGGFTFDGEVGFAGTCSSVSGAGDVNGDGLADVIASSASGGDTEYYPDALPRHYVVYGKTDTSTVDLAEIAIGNGGFAVEPPAVSGQTVGGGGVSGAGDVNGDGLGDIIVGAPDPTTSPLSGRAYVVFGF